MTFFFFPGHNIAEDLRLAIFILASHYHVFYPAEYNIFLPFGIIAT